MLLLVLMDPTGLIRSQTAPLNMLAKHRITRHLSLRTSLHKSSLNHSKNRKQTELSSLIWSLKDNDTPYNLAWSIIDQAQTYQPGKRVCNLCLAEKYYILTGKDFINKKTEPLNKCPHRRKFLACNLKP